MSYLDEAVQALSASDVYVSPSVPGVDVTALKQDLAGTQIAVVILPEAAKQEIGSLPAFVTDLARATNYETFFVEVGADYDAGSRVMPAGEASALANRIEGSTSDPQTAATQFVAEVRGAGAPSDDGVGAGAIAGGAVGVVVLIALAAWVFRRFRTRPTPTDPVPQLFEPYVGDLQARAASLGEADVASALGSVTDRLAALAGKIDDGDAVGRSQIESRYSQRLDTLVRQIDVYAQVRRFAVGELGPEQRARRTDIRAQILRMSTILTEQIDADIRAITSDSFDLAAAELPDFATAFPDAVLPLERGGKDRPSGR